MSYPFIASSLKHKNQNIQRYFALQNFIYFEAVNIQQVGTRSWPQYFLFRRSRTVFAQGWRLNLIIWYSHGVITNLITRTLFYVYIYIYKFMKQFSRIIFSKFVNLVNL